MSDRMRADHERDQSLDRDLTRLIADLTGLSLRPGLSTKTQIALSLAVTELHDERAKIRRAFN